MFTDAIRCGWSAGSARAVLRFALAGVPPDEILRRTRQPCRAPDSASFFVDGQPLDDVADRLSAEAIKKAGYLDSGAVGKLLDECRACKAAGFVDDQAFVGVLSKMLLGQASGQR